MYACPDDNIYMFTTLAKSGLLEKANALKQYLDNQKPDWQEKMRLLFSKSVLRIVRLAFSATYLDCSTFNVLDSVIDRQTVDRYNSYFFFIFGYEFAAIEEETTERFYQHFYRLEYKKSQPRFFKELEKLRSIAEFNRAKVKFECFDDNELGVLPVLVTSSSSILLKVASFNCIRYVAGILDCDYYVRQYFATYHSILNRLIPDKESFDKAKAFGLFEEDDVDWAVFRKFMSDSNDTIYNESFYLFVKRANGIFYNYTGALIRDLRDKMIFEPVTFYFAVITFVFSFLTLIQVLQQANIIPALKK